MAGATLAAERARAHGIALVVLRHIGHAGRIGAYTERMADQGVIAIAFCNSPMHGHFVPPPGAREGRLATNPISFAFPAPGGPVVADFSTSAMPEGAVRLLRDRQREAPPDTLLDARGAPTTDPNSLYSSPPGTILPLGGSRLGHKGFSLGLLVEVMAGTLAGDSVDDRTVRGNSITLLGIDTRLTPTTTGTFDDLAQHLIDYVHSAKPIQPDTPVLMPGEKEHVAHAARVRTGVPVDDITWQAIAERAHRVGHTMPPVMGDHE
jgi:LDH2 family malate/lactate/ureidoglycolate dehydrogenase